MKHARKFLTSLALLLTLAISFALEITIIDVDQGLSVLVRTSDGHTALIDAGPNNGKALEHLRSTGVQYLGLVIATHNDADHIGGLADVLNAIPTTYYVDNAVPHTTKTYERTLQAAAAAGVMLLEPELRSISLGEVTLTLIPPTGQASLGQNDNSVGVLITHGNYRAFIPGDAEATQWGHWLEHYGAYLSNVNLHVASHHGSRNGDTPAGIRHLNPGTVAISLGNGNTYGHPHAEALNNYASAGAQVLRTDQHGTITITAQPDGTSAISIARSLADTH